MRVDAIIIPNKNFAQINEDVIKTSSGSIFHIPICKVNNLYKTIVDLQKHGLFIISFTEKSNKHINQQNLNIPLAIVLGNENNGISIDILNISNKIVKIPIYGKINSLNVSVACGIILYEVNRQKYMK